MWVGRPRNEACGLSRSAAVERLGELLVLVGGRVFPQGDPKLPVALPDLALRSTLENIVARLWDGFWDGRVDN